MSKTVIKIVADHENFAPFGEVIGCTGHDFFISMMHIQNVIMAWYN
jgi:hypothetical protein